MTLDGLRLLEGWGASASPNFAECWFVRYAPRIGAFAWRHPIIWGLLAGILLLTKTAIREAEMASWFRMSLFLPPQFRRQNDHYQSPFEPSSPLSARIVARLARAGIWRGDWSMSLIQATQLLVASDELDGVRFLTAEQDRHAKKISGGSNG